jgi:hypothetical protein
MPKEGLATKSMSLLLENWDDHNFSACRLLDREVDFPTMNPVCKITSLAQVLQK